MSVYIHPNAIVESKKIGDETRVWAFVHILPEAEIGKNCNICDHCFIENKVVLGDNVTVKCGIYIWDGVTVESNVILGPAVVFTNDLKPRSKNYKAPVPTLIKQGASLGANTTVLAGVTVGEFAMTGIGTVVTRDVPSHALVYGNPARFQSWIDESGNDLIEEGNGIWKSITGKRYQETSTGLKSL